MRSQGVFALRRLRPWVAVAAPVVVGSILFLPWARRADAQIADRSVPSVAYYASFYDFYDGEFRDALDEFRDEWRGGIKTPQSRWIDSICYHTMIGECYYHMGALGDALEHYSAALDLYLAFPDWMMSVQFEPAIRPAQAGELRPAPWGPSTRRPQPGHFKSTTLIAQGRLNNDQVLQQGGVVQMAQLFPIGAQEIVRCTTLAIRRRTELLGPLSQYDPLFATLATTLSLNPGCPNHWSQAWVDVQYGLALVATGRVA
ncbi:MAG: tetratricopeptide repeat protein, partial [Planctomycetota bacterium]